MGVITTGGKDHILVPGRHLEGRKYHPRTDAQRRAHQRIMATLGKPEKKDGHSSQVVGRVMAVDEEMTTLEGSVQLIRHSTALVGARLGTCADVVALADTGASRSCISMEFFTRWYDQLMQHGGQFVQGLQVQLAGADNKLLWTTGAVDLVLEIGPRKFRHRFIVIDGLKHDVILGCDFLRATRATINFGNSSLTIEHQAQTFEVDAEELVAGIHVAPDLDDRPFFNEEEDTVPEPARSSQPNAAKQDSRAYSTDGE